MKYNKYSIFQSKSNVVLFENRNSISICHMTIISYMKIFFIIQFTTYLMSINCLKISLSLSFFKISSLLKQVFISFLQYSAALDIFSWSVFSTNIFWIMLWVTKSIIIWKHKFITIPTINMIFTVYECKFNHTIIIIFIRFLKPFHNSSKNYVGYKSNCFWKIKYFEVLRFFRISILCIALISKQTSGYVINAAISSLCFLYIKVFKCLIKT